MLKRHYSAKEAKNLVLFSHSAMNLYVLTFIISYLHKEPVNQQILKFYWIAVGQ